MTGLIENITGSLVEMFQGKVPREPIIFIISLFPILELRGGMIAAKLLGVELTKAFFICYAGNIIPIPFILIFIRRIFALLRRSERLAAALCGPASARDGRVDRLPACGFA